MSEFAPALAPTPEEKALRSRIMALILEDIRNNRVVKLPPFDPNLSRPSDHFALTSVGLEANPYSGTVGNYRYQFEGEEDLLHLIITDSDGLRLSPEAGQQVAGFVLHGLPPAMIWLRPGEYSQHFYFGHDELLVHLVP